MKKSAYFDPFFHLSLPPKAPATQWYTPVERAAATPMPSSAHSSGSSGPALRAAIRARGPVVDVMDTGAACRTYNVLLSEARRVAAALLPVGTPASGGAEG